MVRFSLKIMSIALFFLRVIILRLICKKVRRMFMKFVCERSALLKILLNISRNVSQRSNILALEGVHISVKNSIAYFECFNMEFGLKTSLEVSEAEEGSVVILAKVFTDIVKKLPDSIVSLKAENSVVSITCLDCCFDIPLIPSEEFPKLPCVEDEEPISMSSEVLRSMIQQTIFATDDSSSTNNKLYTGELWEVKNGFLNVVALDGARMSLRKEPVNINTDFKIVIPGKALSEFLRLLPCEDEDIKVYLSERYVFFELENYTFLSRLLEGNFLDYSSAIPSEFSTRIRLNVKNMISSLECVSVIINDRLQSPVKAIIEPPINIKLSCSTPIGKSSDEVEAEVSGEALEIAFNDKYFLDALKSCDSDEVIIELTSSLKPIKIIPLHGDSFLFLVLPVRMKENDS